MEEIKSAEMSMPERLETEIKTEIQIEEFCSPMENIKSEDTRTVDIEQAASPERFEAQSSEKSLELSGLIFQIKNEICWPLRCRLCTIPNDNMIDIFSSNEIGQSIAEKIERSINIVVKETDTLPKQACQDCCDKLELCYQFHKTVSEAERQLLALDSQTSFKFEETERNPQTFSPFSERYETTEHGGIERALKTLPDTEIDNDSTTIAEEGQVRGSLLLASLKPCSVVLVPIVSGTASRRRNNLKTDARRSSSDNEHQNVDSSMDDLNSVETSAPHIDLQSSCESRGPEATRKEKISSLYCEKSFADQESLDIHERADTRKRRYRCHSCAKMFQTKEGIARHQRLHTGKGLHSCEYCEKKFASRSNRNSHHLIHTGERPFKCSICANMFRTKNNLTRHQKVHTGKKLYSCEYCEKKFSSSSNRNSHHLIHTGERPFKCSICANMFRTKNNLTRHQKVHTGEKLYSCEYCEKEFATKASRNGHHLIHTGERPFKCSICTKMFRRKQNLTTHQKLHIGEKLYSFEYCENEFATKASRNSHHLIHTGKRPFKPVERRLPTRTR